MFKSPITYTGEVRYFEVIKYTFLIAILTSGYTIIVNSNVVVSLFSGISVILVLSVFAVVVQLLIVVFELYQLLKALVIPIIEFVHATNLLELVQVKRMIFINQSFGLVDSNKYIKLNVVRC